MIHPLQILVLLGSWLLWPADTTNAAAPDGQHLASFEAEYQLSRGGINFGKTTIRLQLNGDGSYLYEANTLPAGIAAAFRNDDITETSRGELREGTIVPHSYLYHHSAPDRERKVTLTFDWQAGRVTNQTAKSTWSMEIPPGTLDKFSQQLALTVAVAGGLKEVDFQVADGGRLKSYRYTLQEEAKVETPAGPYTALGLRRSKNGKPSRTTLWLAPSLNYLPVMVEKREKEGRFVMELRQISWR